jgi:DNA repair protein RadC
MNEQEVIPRIVPIREWPRTERPREKLLDRGPQALSDAELLAVLLGSGTKGRYAALQAALELSRRHLRETMRIGSTLAAPDATRNFLLAQLRDRP